MAASVWFVARTDHPARHPLSSSPPSGSPSADGSGAPTPAVPSLGATPVGLPLLARTGLRLPVTGSLPGSWDVDTGRISYVSPSPPPKQNSDDYDYRVVPRASGIAFLRPAREPCEGCPGEPQRVGFQRNGQPARMGPLAHRIAPAEGADGVWLATYRFPAVPVPDLRQSAVVQQVDLTGSIRTSALQLPRGTELIRGVRGGLLLQDLRARGRAAFVWNPVSGRVVLRVRGHVIHATSEVIAAQDSDCDVTRCLLHVIRLESGRRSDYATGAGQVPANGAISPDGRFLALEVYGDPDPSDPGILTSASIVVIDLGGSRRMPVPGSEIANASNLSPGYYAVGWSSDSRYVVAQAGQQPVLWRVGASELRLPSPLTDYVFIVPS